MANFIKISCSILAVILLPALVSAQSFMAEQKRYPRVRAAFTEKEDGIKSELNKNSVSPSKLNILFVACKAEQKLELYAKNTGDAYYKLIAVYDICASSGTLGPKREQGDFQVPEGFYHIDRFNPSSSYHLSLGVNYPNLSDKRKSKAANLGGDIFIHGSCVTIGCLPMTDDKIKEIYVYAVMARESGQQKIPVYIFPFAMTDKAMKLYGHKYSSRPGLISFWENLKEGYDKFHADRQALSVSVENNGDYTFR